MGLIIFKNKSDAFVTFKRFKTLAEREKEVKFKWLMTDRGGEFINIVTFKMN